MLKLPLLLAALSSWLKLRYNAVDENDSVMEPCVYNSHVLHA